MKYLLLSLLTFSLIGLSGQENRQYEKHIHPNDSVLMVNLPKLTLPASYKSGGKDLPDYHNNAEHMFFRPIFNQYGWSCGQASSIGYGFTYELNRVRNTSAEFEENQFTPMYTFNFFNKGEDAVGVCYLHTLDAIKHNGNVNVTDYGGMGSSLTYWVDGYDAYYNGMFNRVEEVYAIDVGDEEGLLTLKHYLYDHLEGSPYGGVGNFYTDLYSFTSLPAGTPEEGKSVITAFGSYTGHAMTFLGWNDSIRYDYNSDGQYTNHLDINNDGEVNMKDWEIGGVILANSWGVGWADSGFCYVMYNVLAQEKMDGGIWNKQVNVIKVKETYAPQLTYKVKLTHDLRNIIRFRAGVSTDTSVSVPQHLLDFPVFNFQGGPYYMQGDNSLNEYKTLEFGLDVTPLLSYVESGQPARFFFQVIENDPSHSGEGIINAFSVMDYTGNAQEVLSSQTNLLLNDNAKTTVFADHIPEWDDVTIQTEQLPAFVPGESYSTQLTADGGTEPYQWSITPEYAASSYEETYPTIDDQQLYPTNNSEGFAVQVLDFPFPFYDRLIDTVYIYVDGFLKFDEVPYPLPYQVEDLLIFKTEPVISAFLNKSMYLVPGTGYKLWYEGDENQASFRWKGRVIVDGDDYAVDFAVTLHSDGRIEIFHNTYSFPEQAGRITGISNGDGINFIMEGNSYSTALSTPKKFTYTPQNYPCETTVSDEGMLSFTPLAEDKIFNITVRARDNNNVFDQKTFQLSDGIVYEHSILSGDDEQIDYGETASISFTLTNTSSEPLSDVVIDVSSVDPFVDWIDQSENVGSLGPGESVILEDAIAFTMASQCPDIHQFLLDLEIASSSSNWESKISLTAFAPNASLLQPIVSDENNRLDPGETTSIVIRVENAGHAPALGTAALVETDDPYMTINNNSGVLQFGAIPPGSIYSDTMSVSVDPSTPQGHIAQFYSTLSVEPDIQVEGSFEMLIGRYPAYVVDLDPELLSGPVIQETLEELNILHSYDYYLPTNMDDFQNLFVVLGRQFGQHILTQTEGQKLADFLNAGGNVYMEGGLTWFDDPVTPVHPMFHIEGEYVSWHQIDSVFGVEGTFLDSLRFDYMGDAMYYNYHLQPVGAAFPVLMASEEPHNFAVAYIGDTYKTIGSTLDFGGMADDKSPSTKKILLAKILEFFDVEVIITGSEEFESSESKNMFTIFPNPASQEINIRIKLENPGPVTVTICNVQGEKIKTIVEKEVLSEGTHLLKANIENLPSGVYLCTWSSDFKQETKRLIISE